MRLFLLCLFLFLHCPVFAEPTTTILNNGSSNNRVDIVVLGDGYTSDEMQKYANDVQAYIDGFFAESPYKEYKSYFNVHRVDVISNESGADHPEINVYKDTAMDAYYHCNSIQRLICVNTSKVYTIINNSVPVAAQDIKLVIINDTEYGGSGGSIAVASTHSQAVELVLHEVGHSFGLLADEYAYGTCNNSTEPYQANVTKETRRDYIKWNINNGSSTGWIDINTIIPTTDTTPSLVGLYEGAKYCTNDLYRPTYNSKMRALGKPFEQVNEEQLVKRIYNFVSPLDSASPAVSFITVKKGETINFQANALIPVTHTLLIRWLLDGQVQGVGTQYVLDTLINNTGEHILVAEIQDTTTKVRNDPANVLFERREWSVTILPNGDFDNDGIDNELDNCPLTYNPGQEDNDNDDLGDACDPDDDNDGLSDEDEITIYGTDPFKADTDGDGYSDGEEIEAGTDPLDKDSFPKPDSSCFPYTPKNKSMIMICW